MEYSHNLETRISQWIAGKAYIDYDEHTLTIPDIGIIDFKVAYDTTDPIPTSGLIRIEDIKNAGYVEFKYRLEKIAVYNNIYTCSYKITQTCVSY